MKKIYKQTNLLETTPSTIKKVRHTINELHKIKRLNRGLMYDLPELRKIILDSKQGKKVVKALKEEKITLQWLKDNDFSLVYLIFKTKLD